MCLFVEQVQCLQVWIYGFPAPPTQHIFWIKWVTNFLRGSVGEPWSKSEDKFGQDQLGKWRECMEVAHWLWYLHIIPWRLPWLILSQMVFRGWYEESWFEISLKTPMQIPCYFCDSFVLFPSIDLDRFIQLMMFLCLSHRSFHITP